MIIRKVQNHIHDLLGYFPAVGIIGPRQVGKTTLVKQLMTQIKQPSVYLDLEYPGDLSKLNDPVLFLEQNQDYCILINEVQRMPELFPVLRSLIDQNRSAGRFILLGSVSPEIIRSSSESLAGRIAYVQLTPFNFLEVQDISTLNLHWFRGGFPEALLAPDDNLSKTWLQQFVMTYIERDLPMLGFPGTPQVANRLWQMLAHYNGNLLNASNFSKALGISVPTSLKYIDFFENAFLVRRLQPWEFNAKKRLVKSPKIYIRDTGLLHHLAGIKDFNSLMGNILIGSSWEGYVIEQIAQILPDDYGVYFYRTQAGAEADLVIVRGIKPICCIEIKFTSRPSVSKGLMNVISDLGTQKNYIITPQSDTFYVNKQVQVMKLADFIRNELSELL